MYELKKIGKVFTSKFVGSGPSSYKKRIYRAAFSQRLRKAALKGESVFLRKGFWELVRISVKAKDAFVSLHSYTDRSGWEKAENPFNVKSFPIWFLRVHIKLII